MSKLVSVLSFLIFIISFYYFFDKDKINTMSFELPELERVSTKHFNNGFFGLGPFDGNYVGISLGRVRNLTSCASSSRDLFRQSEPTRNGRLFISAKRYRLINIILKRT